MNRKYSTGLRLTSLFLLAVSFMTRTQAVLAQIVPLYTFTGGMDGGFPYAGLIQASDGNLYGTTAGGGANGHGTVFRITTGGTLTTLYSFTGGMDGGLPEAGLIQAKDGNLYGTTGIGGASFGFSGHGTVFRITTGGTLTTLYSFTGGMDGGLPSAGLIQAKDGNLYGTTWELGAHDGGTVFRITTGGTLITLYSFNPFNGVDGGAPYAGLIQAKDGNLYGTTDLAVFRITTGGRFRVLHTFTGGASVSAGLIQAKDGNLYGTTLPPTDGDATIFRITTGGLLTTLYTFGGTENGYPFASLILAKDGNLYGTVYSSAAHVYGTVFRITTGGTLTTLYSFTYGMDGAYPVASLIQATDGNLYGTMPRGGANDAGTVFRLHWQPLVQQPNFQASTMLLLTDGTVMCQAYLTGQWWRLTPDLFGSYVNGTWSKLASMPSGYGPLFYSSAVLDDGRVVVIGGEYNIGTTQVMTNQGAIYNPATNTWKVLAPPNFTGPNGNNIGDAQCCVLPNGQFLLAHPYDTQMALLDPAKLTWTVFTPADKTDIFDEEGWTLLPDGTILTLNVWTSPNTEWYDTATQTWTFAGLVPSDLAYSGEIGPAVLRPDGTVFATGANGNNAVYDTATGQWSAAKSFPTVTINGTPQQLCIADGPACLLPGGNVLCAASPFQVKPTAFCEFDGSNLNQVDSTPNASSESSYDGRMLLLPTGQVLYSHGNGQAAPDVEVYTPLGDPDPGWAPTITACAGTLKRGTTNLLQGTQLNGLSQAVSYGDDSSAATNYPLVHVTYTATGHVAYFRTHGHSSMGVATGSTIVSTNFDVPKNAEVGAAELEVVANGIASLPYSVVIQ